MSNAVELEVAGETIQLWPERGLYWPRQSILFIADPHFGKSAAFRAVGLAAADATGDDLKRLDNLLKRTRAGTLVILGDLLHARSGLSEATVLELTAWRHQQSELNVALVRGNHDRGAGDPPTRLNINCVDEPWHLGPFSCRHTPGEISEGYVLAGHVHPGIRLRDRTGAGLRAACFVVGGKRAILPAFGSFTGLELVRARRGEKLFAVQGTEIVPI